MQIFPFIFIVSKAKALEVELKLILLDSMFPFIHWKIGLLATMASDLWCKIM